MPGNNEFFPYLVRMGPIKVSIGGFPGESKVLEDDPRGVVPGLDLDSRLQLV